MPPRIAPALSLVLLALVPAAAHAGVPGRWDRVTFPTGANIDQVYLARAPDNVLHVVFVAKNAADQSQTDLFHDAITPAGGVAAPNPVTQGWAAMSNPALLLDGGGLRTFFGGIHTTNTEDPNSNLNTATAPLSGAPWSLFTGTVATGDAAYGGNMSTAAAGGVPWQTWAGTAGVFVHRGLDPSTPNVDLQGQLGSCCGYDPGIVTEPSTGAVVVAWASNATGRTGVFVQALDPGTGQPIGGAALMPGSATGGQTDQQLARTPIAVRPGRPGAFVAYPGNYPTTTRVLLWKVGASGSTVVANGAGEHRNVTVAGAPDGRVWVLWEQRTPSGAPLVFARRSNPDVTAFGETVSFKAPPKASDAWKLDADAQTGKVDVLGSFTTPAGLATWHTQVLPGLTLVTQKAKRLKGGRVSVKVRVLDAGAAVSGASVGAAGKKVTTAADGRATYTLKAGRRRSLTLTAARAGYGKDSAKVKLGG
jgi:hypothetical protein